MKWKVFAVVLSALAGAALGPARAATVLVTTYDNYTENLGVGVTFSHPVNTASFNSPASGFYLDFNNQTSTVGTTVSPYDAYRPFGATLTGNLNVGAAGTYSLGLGSDDGAYLFINNTLVVANPGQRSYGEIVANVNLTSGLQAFKIEYFNGPPSGAAVGLYLPNGVTVTGVPEPSTWALLLLGFVGLGWAAHRRAWVKSATTFPAA